MDLSRYLAIIPARTGSKRLPEKNFRDFCGKPLWQWALECAREVGLRAVVSSSALPPRDWCEEDRGDVWHHIGPGQWGSVLDLLWILRPDFLCRDDASTWEAVEHVCYTREHFGPVVVLQPTSPLRTAEQVRDAIENHAAHAKYQRTFLYTVDSGKMGPNGGIYVSCWREWVGGRPGLTICRPADCGPDIDTQEDWDKAEAAMRERSNAAAPKDTGS